MSADLLRDAAALMRERAEKATVGVCPAWTYQAVRHIARNCEVECSHVEGDPTTEQYPHDPDGWDGALTAGATWDRYDDAEHIASWHPAVALAVADWLDAELDACSDGGVVDDSYISPGALAVARAYLGRES